MRPWLCGTAIVLLAVLATTTLTGQRGGVFRESRDHPAIRYSDGPRHDVVTALGRAVQAGEVALAFEPTTGYLHAVLEALDVPFVRISPGTNHALTSSVFMDDAQAADDMTTHLINAGHRRIGFITGNPNLSASNPRLEGYRAALTAADIAVHPALIGDGLFTYLSGLDAAEQLLEQDDPPTAIFSSNDDIEPRAEWLARIHPEDLPALKAVEDAYYDTGTLRPEAEYRIRRKDNVWIWLRSDSIVI